MNDLWFGLAMVATGSIVGGALGVFVYLIVRWLFPIG